MEKRLNRDEFLRGDDLAREDVDVPELGGTVRVSELSVADLSDFYETFPKTEGGGVALSLFREKLLARTIVDENGQRIFTDDDVPLIGKKSLRVIKRLFDIAQRLNGLDVAANEKK